MKTRPFAVILACLMIIGAIIAGYWDMLESERTQLKSLAQHAIERLSEPEEEPEGADRSPAQPSDTPAADDASTGSSRPGESSSEPGSASNGDAEEGRERGTDGGADTAAADGAGATPASDEAQSRSQLASEPGDELRFDVMRVEPDGSMVVAGSGPAGVKIDLQDRGRVLGSDVSGPDGQFVIVLSEPLSPGAHTIKLSAEDGKGGREVSVETAIVDVPPEGRESELLALIEAPDRPSRLIDLPSLDVSDQAQTAATGKSARAVSGEPGGTADEEADAARRMASVAPDLRPAEDGTGTDTSSSGEGPDLLRIEAIEIENGRIFIAGAAPAGAPIRAYLDNGLLDEARTNASGRYLVETDREVSVGDHMVRVDRLGPSGEVVARVSVPFSRPGEGAMAAVSPEIGLPSAGAAEAVTAPRDPSQAQVQADRGDDRQIASASPQTPAQTPDPATAPAIAPAPPRTTSPDTPSGPAASSLSSRLSTEGTGADAPRDAAPQASGPAGPASGAEEPMAAEAAIPSRVQSPLEARAGRVLIRKGDTLWDISRTTYGAGNRYSVIYLANNDQISDPDLIYPGQIFSMPDTPDGAETPEAGETLNEASAADPAALVRAGDGR
ncbi:LysM peptidoglycan-binding domain-containing protein [Fulvimarina endophytica]|uniref:LysM peptidoglycan-binding domain-containing protein n=1 Tax=Fulvimarina endophytica TaxID=2293836 RepID=A0A371WY77_9HYPH|nr:LysM peptidoglycan-binding domain-containing protein [Fulvimarina endophytica]RFC61933.1 LysM peptidoglycan-binding domain-containing protein [Fulvimarina endophytica]